MIPESRWKRKRRLRWRIAEKDGSACWQIWKTVSKNTLRLNSVNSWIFRFNFWGANYASVLFMSFLFCIIFLGGDLYYFLFYFKLNFVSFLFVGVRGTLPRFRYDKLVYLAWRRFLPLSLLYLLFFVGVRCFIFS